MPNTSALYEHPLSLMVPMLLMPALLFEMLLMPALLFDIRFAGSNTRSLPLYCSEFVFNAVFFAIC